MPECRVCHKKFDENQNQCPRCGFREVPVIGDLAQADKVNNSKAAAHRIQFLNEYDFGVTIYYWKDENGSVVLDRSHRLSFGTGGNLLDKTIWLQQQFARIPDMAEMEPELSILHKGKNYRRIPMKLPVPGGALLQQVGIHLTSDMHVSLLMKNPQEQTQSNSVLFLGK